MKDDEQHPAQWEIDDHNQDSERDWQQWLEDEAKIKGDMYANFFNEVKAYYKDLNSLVKRLQDDYAGIKPFEQLEEDRLGLCRILELIDEMGENNND